MSANGRTRSLNIISNDSTINSDDISSTPTPSRPSTPKKTPADLLETVTKNSKTLYSEITPIIQETKSLIDAFENNNKDIYRINNNIREITKNNRKIHSKLLQNYFKITRDMDTFYRLGQTSQSLFRQVIPRRPAATKDKPNDLTVEDFGGGRTRKHKSRRKNKRKSRKSKHYSRRLL